ncbi:MAG: PLDc_N domain-containing protein [Bacteroidales bacterium]|nr:PLDc_N domain-containing protein [Bacteroidales bacterium]
MMEKNVRMSQAVELPGKIKFRKLRWAILAIVMGITYYSGYRVIHSFRTDTSAQMEELVAQYGAEKEARAAVAGTGEVISPAIQYRDAAGSTGTAQQQAVTPGDPSNLPDEGSSRPVVGMRQIMMALGVPLLVLLVLLITGLDIYFGRWPNGRPVFWMVSMVALPLLGSIFYFIMGRSGRSG